MHVCFRIRVFFDGFYAKKFPNRRLLGDCQVLLLVKKDALTNKLFVATVFHKTVHLLPEKSLFTQNTT